MTPENWVVLELERAVEVPEYHRCEKMNDLGCFALANCCDNTALAGKAGKGLGKT